MICVCGTLVEHKVFNTFDYWYCPYCKTEPNTNDAVPYITIKYLENPLDQFEKAHPDFKLFRNDFERDMNYSGWRVTDYNNFTDKLIIADGYGGTHVFSYDSIEQIYKGYSWGLP